MQWMGHGIFYQNKQASVKNCLHTSVFDGFFGDQKVSSQDKHGYLSKFRKDTPGSSGSFQRVPRTLGTLNFIHYATVKQLRKKNGGLDVPFRISQALDFPNGVVEKVSDLPKRAFRGHFEKAVE